MYVYSIKKSFSHLERKKEKKRNKERKKERKKKRERNEEKKRERNEEKKIEGKKRNEIKKKNVRIKQIGKKNEKKPQPGNASGTHGNTLDSQALRSPSSCGNIGLSLGPFAGLSEFLME